jgi:ribosomal protein L7/L12
MSRDVPSPPTTGSELFGAVLVAAALLGALAVIGYGAIFAFHYLVQAEVTTATVRQIGPGVCNKQACWVPTEISWQDEGQPRIGPVKGGPSADAYDDPHGTTLLGRQFPIRYQPGDRQPVATSEARFWLLGAVVGALCLALFGWVLASHVPEPNTDRPPDSEFDARWHEIRLVRTGQQRIKVAELLRTQCGLTYRDARERVHRAPTSFRIQATPVAALDAVDALRRAGALVELRVLDRSG